MDLKLLKQTPSSNTKKEIEDGEDIFYKYLNEITDQLHNSVYDEDERKEIYGFLKHYIENCDPQIKSKLNELKDIHSYLRQEVKEYKCDSRFKKVLENILDDTLSDKTIIVVLQNNIKKMKEKTIKLKNELDHHNDYVTKNKNNFDYKKYMRLSAAFKTMNKEKYLKNLDKKDLRLLDALKSCS